MIDLAFQLLHGALLAGPNVVRFGARVIRRVRGKEIVVSPPPAESAAALLPLRALVTAGPSADWSRYHGARPEPRGTPRDTVLALSGYERWSPADFDALFEVAEALEIPVDSLWTVIRHESHGDPSALNAEPAAGLIQLTTYARLPGFETKDRIREIAYQTAQEQLRGVVRQHYERAQSTVRGMTPGELMLYNFTPKFVGSSEATVISSRGQAIYDRNHRAFDRAGKGTITVADVYAAAERITAEAHGRRVTREGKLVDASGAPVSVASRVPARVPQVRPVRAPAPPKPAPEEETPPTFVSRSNSAPTTTPAPAQRGLDAVAKSEDEPSSWFDTGGAAVTADTDPRGILLAAVRAQGIEPVTWSWVALPGEDLEVFVPHDAFKATLGETPRVRIPVSYAELREVCKVLGCVPATRAIVDAIYLAASVRPKPVGLVNKAEDTQKMNTVGFVLKYHEQLEKQLRDIAASQGLGAIGPEAIIEPTGKWWILDPKMASSAHGAHAAVNYGWFRTSVKDPIQTPGGVHDDTHADYSQLARAVHRYARRPSTGEQVDLLDVYAEKWPELARFLEALR